MTIEVIQGDDEKFSKRALYLGLVPGHAYALVSCVELQRGTIQLCQLHNPWGSLEWTGDWCDTSPLWTDALRDELRQVLSERRRYSDIEDTTIPAITPITNDNTRGRNVFDCNDGMFWIQFSDLCRYFDEITICMIRHPQYKPYMSNPSSTPFQPWHVQRRKFYFDFDIVLLCDGKDEVETHIRPDKHGVVPCQPEPMCPVYELVVEEDGEFIFSIHQEDQRIINAKPYMDIGLIVYQRIEHTITHNQDKTMSYRYECLGVMQGKLEAKRQRSTDLVTLSKGYYLVVPKANSNNFFEHWLREQHTLRQSSPHYSEIPPSNVSGKSHMTDNDMTMINAHSHHQHSHTAMMIDNHLPIPLIEMNMSTNRLYFSKSVVFAYHEIFIHLDCNNDNLLIKDEIDEYFYRLNRPLLSDEEFREFRELDCHHNDFSNKPVSEQGLTMNAFIEMEWQLFTRHNDEQRLLYDFKVMGFDNQLILIDGRPCALVVHSTCTRYTLKGLPMNEVNVLRTQSHGNSSSNSNRNHDSSSMQEIVRCEYHCKNNTCMTHALYHV